MYLKLTINKLEEPFDILPVNFGQFSHIVLILFI